MKVDISIKIAIIRRYKISPDELTLLLKLNPATEILSKLAQGNYQSLIDWINSSINNSLINDEHRLCFAHLANIIEKHIEEEVVDSIVESQRDAIHDMIEDYEQDIVPCDNWTESDVEEQYKEFKKHKKKIQSWSQEEIKDKLIKFVETEFPNIFESGIRGKKRDVRNAFYASIHLYTFGWDLNEKTINNLCQAEAFLVKEVEKRRVEYERRMITEWTHEFKNWCKNLGITKYTKSNIKEFFNEQGLKVLPTTIDLVKYNL